MNEIACQFAENNRLHGVLTTPDNEKSELTLILISAGFLSTQGPFRLYTLLARHLASLNIATLRFDLGGIGNSEMYNTTLPLEERTMQDIKHAVDFVASANKNSKIVLCGLCSGAEDSFKYAALDSRINGIVLIDPHCYQTSQFKIRKWTHGHYLKKIAGKFLNLSIRKIVNKFRNIDADDQEAGNMIDYQYLPFERSSRILKSLMEQKTLTHYIYTGAMNRTLNHAKQLYEIFGFLKKEDPVSVEYIPYIEHTQIMKEDRNVLIKQISDRLVSWPLQVENV